jgi:hypothetical protein
LEHSEERQSPDTRTGPNFPGIHGSNLPARFVDGDFATHEARENGLCLGRRRLKPSNRTDDNDWSIAAWRAALSWSVIEDVLRLIE